MEQPPAHAPGPAGRSGRRPRPGVALLALALALGPAATELPADADENDEFSAVGVRAFRREQPRPIALGTSGGNANAIFPDEEPGFVVCTSGTLGGLVLKNGIEYILGNNHVLALENEARRGDPIVQPGLIDSDCRSDEEDVVGHLAGWKRIRFGGEKVNRSDVAIAEVVPGTVDPRGTMVRLGVPGRAILEPWIGMPVKKVGRTTGRTHGTITAVNVSFLVTFSGAGGSQNEALFVRQLVVEPRNPAKPFVGSGDSGAVVVFDREECPEWVGLLFAGSDDGIAAVNPIQRVLRDVARIKPRGEAAPIGCESAGAPAAAALAPAGEPGKLELSLRRARRVQERHQKRLLGLDGVVGVGLGVAAGDDARAVLKVFVTGARVSLPARVPRELDGIATDLVVSGRFHAL